MSLGKDHDLLIEGNTVVFFGRDSASGRLRPGQSLIASLDLIGGSIVFDISSLDARNPTRIREVAGEPVEEWQLVPVRVELLSHNRQVVLSWITPEGWVRSDEAEGQGGSYDAENHSGRWTVRVTNVSTGRRLASCSIGLRGIVRREFIGSREISLRVINDGFKVVLEALAPRAELQGSTGFLSFSPELAQFGFEPRYEFRLPSPLEGESRLLSVDVGLGPGELLLGAVQARWEQTNRTLRRQLEQTTSEAARLRLQRLIDENDRWRNDWYSKVDPAFVTLHAEAVATAVEINADLPGAEIDVADIERVSVHAYIAIDMRKGQQGQPALLTPGWALVLSPARFSGGIADVLEDLGFLPEAGQLIEKSELPTLLQSLAPKIAAYLAEVFVRLADGGGVFIGAAANGTGPILVLNVPEPPIRESHTGPGLPQDSPTPTIPRPDVGGSDLDDVPPDPVGIVPSSVVIDSAGLDRLDRIDTFIVVMMENRSFDHMLGYLRQRNDQYEGLTGNESNPPPPDRQGAIRVQPVADVLTSGRVTQIPVSPHHHTEHVAAQMNGGAMDGFVRDFASRTDFVELVMTYYGGSAGQRGFLPVHDRVAMEFSVCDHWFSAHPGPTWPNRWAMLMGQIPELENLDIDDPRIGFLRERTIFDALRSAEPPIDFRCYHRDVTMLRMYNRYRLDDRSVLPFDDPDEGFEKVAREGRLPPVVFVDPNFVDMPPVGTADDDHPPADLRRGQDFLKRVFDAVVTQERGRWQSSLLLITYDEHGGFFDHVAPPGTPAARPDLQAPVPRLHPDGPTFMGPRVPTFVVSPWVGAGSVCKTVFDHTSIFKTLIVRYRDRLRWGTFPLSQRVKVANHLGAALDQQQPRSDVPAPFEQGRTRRRVRGEAFVTAIARRPLPMQPADGDRQDFHAALARAGFPKRAVF